MEIILVQVVAFFAIFLMVMGIRAAFAPRATAVEQPKPVMFQVFFREIEVLGPFVYTVLHNSNPAQTVRLSKLLLCSNVHVTVKEVRGLQVLAGTFGLLAGGLLVFLVSLNVGYTLMAALLLGWIGWLYPAIWLSSTAQQRQHKMSRSLPYAVDLLTVAMEAGQDFTAAMRHLVAEGLKGPLADEFRVVLRQMELGKNRIDALRDMAIRVQLPEFQSLVTAVTQSTEMGASISTTLKIQAEDIRRRLFHKAERQAARAPSLMMLPMALFIMPAVFIIIVTPIFLRMQSSGMSSMMFK